MLELCYTIWYPARNGRQDGGNPWSMRKFTAYENQRPHESKNSTCIFIQVPDDARSKLFEICKNDPGQPILKHIGLISAFDYNWSGYLMQFRDNLINKTQKWLYYSVGEEPIYEQRNTIFQDQQNLEVLRRELLIVHQRLLANNRVLRMMQLQSKDHSNIWCRSNEGLMNLPTQLYELSARNKIHQDYVEFEVKKLDSASVLRFYDREAQARKGEDYRAHRVLCSPEGRDSLRSYLNHKVSFNDQTENGLTPLDIACMRGNAEQVYLLLSGGSDASINEKRNISPLHYPVSFPEKHIPAIAWALIRAGARVNSQPEEEAGGFFDNLGMCLLGTPLQWAIICRNQVAMSVLLYLGASIFGGRPESRLDYFFACAQTFCADTLEILLRESLTTQPLHGRDAYNLFFHAGS
ncbi:hypothetical protein TWF106_001701 [Orbilia oligospora]|uniref:Uncharacterized protein n=1 Tax=Orbilia oligospora TaxID=2813651 RepID=A0A7C8QXD5_ORBOL|nr:hypothetical protein TWF106_001701 [Orbilia oligospora]